MTETVSAWKIFLALNDSVFGFFSTENPGKRASRSELRRWFEKGTIWMDGKPVGKEKLFPVSSEIDIVIHPKSKQKIWTGKI